MLNTRGSSARSGDATAFNKKFLNDLVENHTVSPRGFSKSTFLLPHARHAHAASEEGSTIGDYLDCGKSIGTAGRHVFRQILFQSPLTHDKSIIDGMAVHLVGAEGLDLVVGIVITRDVSCGACRGNIKRNCGDRIIDKGRARTAILTGMLLNRCMILPHFLSVPL